MADLKVLQSEVKSLHHDLNEEKRLRGKLEKEMAGITSEMTEEKTLRVKLDGVQALEKRTWSQEIAALRTQLSQQNEQHSTERIAFSVHTQTNFGPVTVRTKIPFPFENVNIGGGWQPHIDVFQAPVAGHYFFFCSIRSSGSTMAHVSIIHTDTSGDHILASTIAGDSKNGDANAAIVYLGEDEYVSVQLNTGYDGVVSSNSNKYTTFSGFLLDNRLT